MAGPFYSQGDGNWSTVTNWDTNAGGGGTDPTGADAAGMDDAVFIIQAGHEILMDVDMSAWPTGIISLLIQSHASTPGMLYWKDGQNGILKIKSGAVATNRVQGNNTSATCKGRILVNSSGLWTGSTASATLMASQFGASGAVSDGGGAKRIFTPTVSPAWVVDALIGESIKINGSTYVIEDNDATTATITTGPAIGATVTSWELVVRPLPKTYKAIIRLGALSQLTTQYLDILMHGVEPTRKTIRTYGTTESFTVVAATDVLTLATALATILTANVPVYVSSSGTLPAGLSANTLYYVRSVSGATCKLSTTASDVGLVDITDTGVGTHFITTGVVEVASIAANLIDCVPAALPATPWANDQIVMFTSTGTYPSGIEADTQYFIRDLTAASGTFKICGSVTGAVIPIGTSWVGTLKALVGGKATTLASIAVLDDISADTDWVATGDTTTWGTCTDLSAVQLVGIGPSNVYDCQRQALKAKTASVITLNAVIDSALWPGSLLFIVSRNVAIHSEATTGIYAVECASNTTGGVFACEVRNRYNPSASDWRSYGITSPKNYIISGIVAGWSYPILQPDTCIIAATILGYNGIYGPATGINLISGIIAGAYTGGLYNMANTIFSGIITGCYYGISTTNIITITGNIIGSFFGLHTCGGVLITGNIISCDIALQSVSHAVISGLISKCTRGLNGCAKVIVNNISHCYYGSYGGWGLEFRGDMANCVNAFRDADGYIPVKSCTDPLTFYARNIAYNRARVAVEQVGNIANNHKVYDNFGDIVRQKCDGATAGYPDTDPDGLTSTYCIGAINPQSGISVINTLDIISHLFPHQMWLVAGTYTITYKVFTTYTAGGGIASGGLVLAANYISAASPLTNTRLTSTNAIAQAVNDTDWSQTLAITITTAVDGWASFDIYLTEYEASKAVFIWPVPVVT